MSLNKFLFSKAFSFIKLRHLSTSAATTAQSSSSLYVSDKDGQNLFRVLHPTFNDDYLKYVENNLEKIQRLFQSRSIENDYFNDLNVLQESLKNFRRYSVETDRLKKKRKKIMAKLHNVKLKNDHHDDLQTKFNQYQTELNESRDNLFKCEEQIVPFLLQIPCEINFKDLNDDIKIIDQWKKSESVSLQSYQQIKQNYVRLGYINNLYTRSIVGPSATYLLGDGSLLYYSLIDMFHDKFKKSNYKLLNGLDLVKSAIIESINNRSHYDDALKLSLSSGHKEDNQRLHLVGEASLESFCAWLTKQSIDNIDSSKYYQIGSTYNHENFEQNHLIRATIIAKSSESIDLMFNELYKLIWSQLETLKLERLSLRTNIQSLRINEYDKIILLSWLQSKKEWIEIGEIINHHHYIIQRLGLMKNYSDYHLLTGTINLVPLIYSLVEQVQICETGKLALPDVLKQYSM